MTEQKIIAVSSISELTDYNMTDICTAVGVFDGVHLGHRALLTALVENARRLSATPVAVTFSPHPREVLFPSAAPRLLLPPERRIKLLHEYGAKAVVTLNFTKELSTTPPREFVKNFLMAQNVKLRGICVGSDWRFGAGANGDAQYMKKLAAEFNFDFIPVPELVHDGETVSSSLVRANLSEGYIRRANQLLGRNYTLCGKIAHGMHIASSKLDCPTANLEIQYGIIPPIGVYASIASVKGRRFRAITNIGTSPTFDSYGKPENVRIEVHLLDGQYSLYGENLELELVRRIRSEIRFDSPETLKKQIQNDIAKAREFLEKEKI